LSVVSVPLPVPLVAGRPVDVVEELPGTFGVPSVLLPLLLQVVQLQFPWECGMPGRLALPLGKVEFTMMGSGTILVVMV